MDIGHTKGRLRTGRIRQGKETKNLSVVDVLTGWDHHGKWTREE
jgi:hypothetical protein